MRIMALEKTLLAIPAQLLISNGGRYGQVQIPSTVGFKLKQRVQLFSNNIAGKVEFEVKRVLDETNLIIGPKSQSLEDTADLTNYLTAMNAVILAPEQPRQAITPDLFSRAVFEESPTVAIRTFAVDHLGRRYTEANPFPVQLSNGSINIGTVNAQLETFLTHKDNDPKAGDVHSSLRIGDGTDELQVNPDGSLNVVVTSGGKIPKPTKNIFNEVTAVPMNSETLLVTYTVPTGEKATLDRVTGSGENIAKFSVYLNGSLYDVQRTYYAGGFNVMFDYQSQGDGVVLQAGDVLQLKVIHWTSELGDFDGRIQLVEIV
jgi:hypothetical protein